MPATMIFGVIKLADASLYPVSQLLLRNKSDWLQPGLLLVNPPDDALVAAMEDSTGPPDLWCIDYAQYEYHRRHSNKAAAIEFTTLTDSCKRFRHIILFQPREKALLEYLSSRLTISLSDNGQLWLVGEKRAGINSSAKRLAKHFGSIRKRDAARHCALFQASSPSRTPAIPLADLAVAMTVPFRGQQHRLTSLPGTFSHGELDPASELLLQSLDQSPPHGRLLDFGCGNGVLGLMASLEPAVESVELIDSNAFAIASATLNAATGKNILIYPSNGFSQVQQRFDMIISNPPFHSGIHTNLDTSLEMIRRAPEFINAKGELRIVANRHLPYYKTLCENFKRVTRLLESSRFIVYRAVQR